MHVLGLVLIGVLTFLAGFLQATAYNFLNYVAYLVFFTGGWVLLARTRRSNQTLLARAFVLVITTATTLIGLLYAGYEWFRLRGDSQLAGEVEGIVYLMILVFIIGVAGALISIRRPGATLP